MARKKKNGPKKSRTIYALVVIVLGLANLALALFLLFYVQKIEVKGNEYTDKQEIINLVQEDPASVNALYLLWKYRFSDYDMPASLESMKTSMTGLWKMQVTVEEKTPLGYVLDGSHYVYFDKEGTVILKSVAPVGDAPRVEGINVGEAELYEPLESGDKKLFKAILDVTREAKEFELSADRLVCNDGDIHLYFGDVCVDLGSNITTDKMAQISPVLEKLEGKKGTLHLERYGEGAEVISFTEGELPEDGEAADGSGKKKETAEDEKESSDGENLSGAEYIE